MIERWALALCCLAAAGASLFALRRRSPADLLVLAVGASALVAVFYPLATSFVDPLTWRNVHGMAEETLLSTQRQYLAFALGVLLVALAAGRSAEQGRPSPRPPSAREAWRDGAVSWGLLACGLLLYAAYVSRVGLDTLSNRHDMAAKYRESTGLGIWLFGLNLAIAGCLWAEGSRLRPLHKLPFRAAAAAIALWAVGFLAVRTYALALGVGWLHLFCRGRRVELRRVPLTLVAGLLLGYLAVEAYSLVRGTWRDSLLDAVQTVYERTSQAPTMLGQWVGSSELSHPFITTMELVRDEEAGALGGSSYLEAALILVPLALLPDRPESLAQSFAAEYYPELDARGGGTAFSLVGEAWWSLGSLLGPLLAGAGLASLLAWIGRRAERRPHGVTARLAPYGAWIVVLVHRSTAAGVLKHLMPLALAVLLLAAAARLAWAALAGRARPQAGRSPRSLVPRGLPLGRR